MYYRSLISSDLMYDINKGDCNFSGVALNDTRNLTAACAGYLTDALSNLAGINIYNLYGPCWNYNASANATNFTAAQVRDKLYGKTYINGKEEEYQKFYTAHDYTPWVPNIRRKLKDEDGPYGIPACIWALPAAEQLNNKTVQM